jgi:hypothetical protein
MTMTAPEELGIIELTPPLTLNPDTAFAILLKAREYDAKVPSTDPDSASNPSDDNEVDVLESRRGDPTAAELVSAINELNDDERYDLIALVLIGQGDYGIVEWADARTAAGDVGRAHVARFIAEIPTVSDFLEEALSQLGYSIEDFLDDH